MFTTEEHWRYFAEFARWELASGGPDPQLAMIVEMCKDQSEIERVWRALCYIATYNVPYGEVIWHANPWPALNMAEWVDAAFAAGKITTRVERRCVRRVDWMQEYFVGAKRFVEDWPALKETATYETAWERITKVPRIGRYTAIKLIELLRRGCGLKVVTPDIRPKGAWSPRETLDSLFPDRGLAQRSDAPDILREVNTGCAEAIARLRDYDVVIDLFQLQVLLCEYRESWESKRQYPGRSLDSELGYAMRAEKEWSYVSDIWAARTTLFPWQHLGEARGWVGPRKDVASVLANHKFTWSDLLYNYVTTEDVAKPVGWPP